MSSTGRLGKASVEKFHCVQKAKPITLLPTTHPAELPAFLKGSNLMICSIFKPEIDPSFIFHGISNVFGECHPAHYCGGLNNGLKMFKSSLPGQGLCGSEN